MQNSLREVGDSIIPHLGIRRLPIKDSGVPVDVRSHDNVRESLPFLISVRTDGKVWKAVMEREKMHVSVRRLNALQATINFQGLVVNLVMVPFKLS